MRVIRGSAAGVRGSAVICKEIGASIGAVFRSRVAVTAGQGVGIEVGAADVIDTAVGAGVHLSAALRTGKVVNVAVGTGVNISVLGATVGIHAVVGTIVGFCYYYLILCSIIK